MSHRPDEDLLAARYRAAAPELTVDPQTVLRAARRRRSIGRVGVAAVTLLGVSGVSLAASALPLERPAHVATQGPASSHLEQRLRTLADQLDAQATPVPTGQAFHVQSTDWGVAADGRVEIISLERTANPDGTISQVQLNTGKRDDLAVGDPVPHDAQRTEMGPSDQGRPDWAFEDDLPDDPAALRTAWLDSCGVDPTVGATEYRCVYVGMQETLPTAIDTVAADVLRLLVDEPGVTIEEITDRLGRDRIAATFDLPDEGTVSYLIDPETGRIDGVQTEGEHSSWVSRWTTDWVEPASGQD